MSDPVHQTNPAGATQKGRFRTFVERHDALFTTLGALIVFASFFIKEGVRQTSEDLALSIRTSRNMFSLQTAIDAISQNLDSEAEIIDSTHSLVKRTQPVPLGLDVDQLALRVDLLRTGFRENRETYVIASELLQSLPVQPPDLTAKSAQFKGDLILGHKPEDVAADLLKSIYGIPPGASDAEKNGVIRRSYLATIMVSTDLFAQGSDLEDFTRKVLEQADEQKDKQERNLEWSTRLTYVMFAIGWTLSLSGKILKLPALGGSLED